MTRRPIITAAGAILMALIASGDAPPGVAAGRQIYSAGESSSPDAITASIGGDPMPAALLPCLNCHGADGSGNAEGGVVPSNITWLELTKPYRTATPSGRRRPAYDEQTLRRAITAGVDSAGNPLHAAMPRYSMAPADLDGLLAYLKVLGREDAPGVSDTTIRLATVVPEGPPGSADGLRQTLSAAGEIHGRTIELDVIRLSGRPGAAREHLRAELARRPPLALVGGDITGFEDEVAEVVEAAAVPLILPVARHAGATDNHHRLYLLPGAFERVEAVLEFLRTENRRSRAVAVITADEKLFAQIAVRNESTARRIELLHADPLRPDAAEVVRTAADVIVADNTPRTVAGLERLLMSAPAGRLFMIDHDSAVSAGSLRRFNGSIVKVSPSSPSPEAMTSAAAAVVIEALRTAGRSIDRQSLRSALERLYNFQTGVTPPVTFTRQRRTGITVLHLAGLPAPGAVPVALD